MDLFTPVAEPHHQNPNFARVLIPSRAAQRAVVQSWSEGFPDRDNKFVYEFQTTFNSSFWELYLHAAFKEYGFEMDWSNASPDFHLRTPLGDVIVEAVTANAARGAVPEWEKTSMISENVAKQNFWPLNRAAMIRLSNSLLGKLTKFRSSYQNLEHVKGRPFVVAVAPFEQPDFQYQYDRPMRALLYDDYVDETVYFQNPEKYPDGPPSLQLGSVEKDNGSSIDLGIFNHDGWVEISAVIFSCVATWGKAVAMSTQPALGSVTTSWGTDRSGRPIRRVSQIGTPSEVITDGLQIFHNPKARRPLDRALFRRPGVVQHYIEDGETIRENYDQALQFRLPQSIEFHSGTGPEAGLEG
jgi:hypothetical protein